MYLQARLYGFYTFIATGMFCFFMVGTYIAWIDSKEKEARWLLSLSIKELLEVRIDI